jgi:hypothetical protein
VVGTSGRGEERGKGIGGKIWCKYYMPMYVNGKMRSVETIPGMGGERGKGEGCREQNPV